jgi:predicted Rossmann-fold nucleotide-binding protein
MIMGHRTRNHHAFRGLLQSEDGVITRVLKSGRRKIVFETTFGLNRPIAELLYDQPEVILFSERSRIARLGIQIESVPISEARLCNGQAVLTLEASSVIPGYPGLDELRDFFTPGLPVGRLVYCDPEALLTSEEVLDAVEHSVLKLPASAAISSDGSIVIAPHKIACRLKEPLTKDLLGRILLREDGRELLNRYQVRHSVPAVTIAPGEGLVTTCSMYLNEHFVVLQSGFSLGRNLAATVLDPIKTRGIRIYLEIINQSQHPIVNPLITAKVYRAARRERVLKGLQSAKTPRVFSYSRLRGLGRRFQRTERSNCHFIDRPMAVISNRPDGFKQASVFLNGPESACRSSHSMCALARRDFSAQSACRHRYATGQLSDALFDQPAAVAAKYFPNLIEHRDLVNLTCDGKIEALYFLEPSCEHGPFLSQMDHNRLQEYHAFGLEVYWVSGLTRRLMVHTMRDGMGYFVVPERLADFHKSMLFAFYGSNQKLSLKGEKRLGELMDALIAFWGRNIGIVTGGGSGVMEQANRLARRRGILSGANFLEITDQSMTTDVDFCQMFQSTCRHSRQKWFEIASFPIFNVGGLGSLEELGITLCNMKLSIIEPVPIILFDTEDSGTFWSGVRQQVVEMVRQGRAPAWAADSIVITDDPQTVIRTYRERLQLF